MMQADLLREELQDGPMTEQAQAVMQSAERCARIVRNFLTLARQHPPERQWVALNRVVQEAVVLQLAPDLPMRGRSPPAAPGGDQPRH